VIGIL
jgi:Calcium-activated chloride channel